MGSTIDPDVPKSLNISWLGAQAAMHVREKYQIEVPDDIVNRWVRVSRQNRDKILELVRTEQLDDQGLVGHAGASLHQAITNPGNPCCHQCAFHPCPV